ncbi:MAG: DsbA family protein [Steroidobacteraceae bacterium]
MSRSLPALLAVSLTWLSLFHAAAAETPADAAASYPALGLPDAPVVLEEWSDFLCPFCRRHFQQTVPQLMERYVQGGQLQVVFRDFPIDSLHPTAIRGHALAHCIAQSDAEAFWRLHGSLFNRQGEWARLPDPAGFLRETAVGLGIATPLIDSCLDDESAVAAVRASVEEGAGYGINGTPAFRVYRRGNPGEAISISGAQPFARFEQVIDALLAGEAVPEPEAPPPPELPDWAKPEARAADPARAGFTLRGDPYKGDPQAPLVVIEFSDFQCPACAKHHAEVQPGLDAEFVDSGKVRWIYRSLPLRSHPQALLAAVAAECAAEQDQFWPMQDKLFATVERWGNESVETTLIELAGESGLDRDRFADCLGRRQPLERVLEDIYDGRSITETVPSFAILGSGASGTLTGPRALPQFADLLRKLLEREQAAPTQ